MAVHLAKGARDFLPATMRRRKEVISRIEKVFERFGFEPLGTPAFERIETLTGKYGDEGDKLMFRILKRGRGADTGKADMALRYDLTVPLARVLAMNAGMRMPFKRYQIAPVWRADRPQRGRFREFYQCDADIAGTTSPMADAECLAVAATALGELGFDNFVVRLNDRRILRSMVQMIGEESREVGVLVAVDKLDKIGREGVTNELRKMELSDESIERLWAILDIPRGHHDTLDALQPLLNEEGAAGIAVLHEVLDLALAMGVPAERIVVDPTLARGLDYYTGPVFEAEVLEPHIGSVAGGGRYDGLVGMFSGRDVPAVGVSLGLERLITVMEELGMLGAESASATAIVTVYSADTRSHSVAAARYLREAGVNTELILHTYKLKNQLKYANARGIPYGIFLGPTEIEAGTITIRDFQSGEQSTIVLSDAPAWFSSK